MDRTKQRCEGGVILSNGGSAPGCTTEKHLT